MGTSKNTLLVIGYPPYEAYFMARWANVKNRRGVPAGIRDLVLDNVGEQQADLAISRNYDGEGLLVLARPHVEDSYYNTQLLSGHPIQNSLSIAGAKLSSRPFIDHLDRLREVPLYICGIADIHAPHVFDELLQKTSTLHRDHLDLL